MARYLYRYLQLFGYVGAGTPDDPGSDFGMSVWIDAANEDEAKTWGKAVLHDYVRARFRYSNENVNTERYEGEIVSHPGWLQSSAECGYPVCRVGEMPTWFDPWKSDNAPADRKPTRDVPLEELVTGTVLIKLRAFLRTADKTRGSSHPSDFDHWCAFLTEAHRKRARFSGMQLERWLIEIERWPEDVSGELGEEYSAARGLLGYYDDETGEGSA
ncbi:MAG TPA: hypothetical protein VFE47_03680 [Tepidisphaeraceae bacterium]|jgi:hypothetical protein|nr:hypothetical protein [Tepidisphaeraceae bacterium]